VGAITTFCRKTSPRPRAFRLPAPFVGKEAGRRAAFVRLCEGGRWGTIEAGRCLVLGGSLEFTSLRDMEFR